MVNFYQFLNQSRAKFKQIHAKFTLSGRLSSRSPIFSMVYNFLQSIVFLSLMDPGQKSAPDCFPLHT
jgi:hypothetical protein